MAGNEETFYERNKFKIWFLVFLAIIGAIAIAALVIAERKQKPYTESLYSDVLNPATFKQSAANIHQTLYSYPLSAGQGTNNSGFFTIVMDGPHDIPPITFDVTDHLDRSILVKPTRVGKTTIIRFNKKDDSTMINLHINPRSNGIILTSLSITLDR
tara:strand:- start:179 stop:649 length:471 start_codon:yes stop_codon:yes gene_type:complete